MYFVYESFSSSYSTNILEIVDNSILQEKTHRSFSEHTYMASAKQSFKPSTVRGKKFDELLWILCSPLNFVFSSPGRNDGP